MPGHYADKCRKPSICSVSGCGHKHTKFLHTDALTDATVSDTNQPGTGEVTNVSMQSSTVSGNVYLPIVPVKINHESYVTYALLDSGSTSTFISQRLASRLSLDGDTVGYQMNTLDRSRNVKSKVVSISVALFHDKKALFLLDKVLVVPNIPVRGNKSVDIACHDYLSYLPVKHIPPNAQVDLLIGMDNAHLIMSLELRNDVSGKCTIYATKSRLGWSLNGPVGDGLSEEMSANFISLEDQVENLWRFENLDKGLSMSVEDRNVLSLWDSSTSREGYHYVLPIPWKPGCPKFPDNRHIAVHRLHSLESKLGKSGLQASYSENIDKLVSKGYAEPVPAAEVDLSDGTIWYIPHPCRSKP